MVGKIKRVRQKLHQEAVKLGGPGSLARIPGPPPFCSRGLEKEPKTLSFPPVENQKNDASTHQTQVRTPASFPASFPAAIFAGTKITLEALQQTLKLEEPADVPTPARKGPEDQKVKPKKEKMKERRERWLSKISSIKQAKEQQAAAARRQATPVVGDMRPLADALPELSQPLGPAPATANATACAARRRNRKNKAPVKKCVPTDFSRMKQSHKRKLLETETGRFGEAVKILATKTNPLADIGEQLRKRMRQEEERGSS